MQPVPSEKSARFLSNVLPSVGEGFGKKLGKRAALAFGVTFALVLGCLIAADQKKLDREIVRAEVNLLNAFEFYAQFSRNVRSITQRYDMLLASTESGKIEPTSQENIEALMLQSSFALGQEYFFLRGVNGHTRVEIRRGTVQSIKSDLRIRGEAEFSSLSDVFLSRSCRINGITHYCLIDVPNKREFVPSILRTYSLVALTVPEAVLYSRYKTTPSSWPLQDPSLFLRVDDDRVQLAYGPGDMGFLVTERPMGNGIAIQGGFYFFEVLVSALSVAFLLTVVTLVTWYSIDHHYGIRVARHTSLALLQEKLKHFEQTKVLIRGVVHDIKSPLGTLKALVQMEHRPEMRKLLELLSKRMGLIVSDLELKGKASGHSAASLLPMNKLLRLVLKEKCNEFKDAITLELDLPAEESWIRGEYSEVLRMMSNLLNNAREASREGARVWISARLDRTGQLILAIKDEGKGIPKGISDRIFDNGASFGKDGGTGYGLFHAKVVMEKMGGRMQVESQVGLGTTFTLFIPAERPPSWAVERIDLRDTKTIAVVDDEEFYHQTWKARLPGREVSTFFHPSELPLEWLDRPEVLILLDNNFGAQYGEGLRFLQKHPARRCVLVTSDWGLPEVQRAAQKAGVGLIGKEFLDQLKLS